MKFESRSMTLVVMVRGIRSLFQETMYMYPGCRSQHQTIVKPQHIGKIAIWFCFQKAELLPFPNPFLYPVMMYTFRDMRMSPIRWPLQCIGRMVWRQNLQTALMEQLRIRLLLNNVCLLYTSP